MKCNAGWYEFNISAPDDQVSACCFYRGPKDQWLNEDRDLDFYWNSANFQTLRRVNIEQTPNSGCEGCYFFQNKLPETQYTTSCTIIDESSSPLQRSNWKLAMEEFEANRQILTAKPLRFYVNFGFACNLSCIQCHQVPRRATNGRQASFDVLYKWREHFKSALEVCVIGGEPFALVEALKFIRAFVEDEELKDVRLSIFTNGTLHHRHMETLVKKRKLYLVVSMDSIGDAYDYIRVDGKWDQVEKNALEFIETGKRLNLDWKLTTTSALMKTGIPKLPEFADWCGRHGIASMFFELISARGVEKAVASENVVANPWLVRQVPGWKNYFTEAARIYRSYNMLSQAGSLEYFRDLIERRLQAMDLDEKALSAVEKSTDWTAIFDQNIRAENFHAHMYGSATLPAVVRKTRWLSRYLVFQPTHLNDHLASEFADLPTGAAGDRCVRMTWWWPGGVKEEDQCLVSFQDQNFMDRWNVDFERNLADRSVQRHMILGGDSKQFRLMFRAPDAKQQTVLPTRVKIEFRYEKRAPIPQEKDLVQISAAS